MSYWKHFAIIISLLFIGITASAQVPTNLDEDIWAIRNTAMPNFHCIADDYTQYAPAAVMLGLKVCGYEGRTDWGQMLVSDALSVA